MLVGCKASLAFRKYVVADILESALPGESQICHLKNLFSIPYNQNRVPLKQCFEPLANARCGDYLRLRCKYSGEKGHCLFAIIMYWEFKTEGEM